jgi:hypothetical protein
MPIWYGLHTGVVSWPPRNQYPGLVAWKYGKRTFLCVIQQWYNRTIRLLDRYQITMPVLPSAQHQWELRTTCSRVVQFSLNWKSTTTQHSYDNIKEDLICGQIIMFIKITILWDMTPYTSADGYHCFWRNLLGRTVIYSEDPVCWSIWYLPNYMVHYP